MARTDLGRCETCGRRAYVQSVVTYPPDAGTDQRSLCQDCAGARWELPVMTPALAAVLDELEEWLEERADQDADSDGEGGLTYYQNDEARLVAALRDARGGRR